MFARHLFDAIQTIHSHGQAAFHERVFMALDRVFADSRYALELFGEDGSYALESNLPFNECREGDIVGRTEELVKTQSPMFKRLAEGESSPMRLSDFVTQRQLRVLDLYHDVFRKLHIRYQIGIPVRSSVVLGGLTINRKSRDYTGDDVKHACILAPQIATAFEADLLFRKLQRAASPPPAPDYTHLRRLSLSVREAEILTWMAEAKRDRDIAIILDISVRTVQQHVRSILQKLRVPNRTAAVRLALKGLPDLRAAADSPKELLEKG